MVLTLPRPVLEGVLDAEETYAPPEDNRSRYLRQYRPYADRYGAETGISPDVLLAIGASESNWGASGTPFGIKGKSSSGRSKMYDTWEMINGQRVDLRDEFAEYDDPEEAYGDFVKLLQGSRYKGAADYVKQSGDSAGFLRMINDAGYATDPEWADKVVSIANGIGGGNMSPAARSQGIGITGTIAEASPRDGIQGMYDDVVTKARRKRIQEIIDGQDADADATGEAFGRGFAEPTEAPEYGDDYVDAPTGSLRAILEQRRQGESQYGRIPEVVAEKPLDIATLAAYPFAPGWLATDVAADKASELAGGGIPGLVSSTATGIAGPGLLKGLVKGLRGSQADDMLRIIGREAQDPVTMYQRAREAGFSDEDIARAFGDDAVRLGKGTVTREGLDAAAEEARGLEDTANAMRYSKKSPRGSLASRVRGMAERMAGEGPVSSIVGGGMRGADDVRPSLPGTSGPEPGGIFDTLSSAANAVSKPLGAVARNTMGALGAARSTFASGDIPLMRQGGILGWTNPKETLRAFEKGVESYRFSDQAPRAIHDALKQDELYDHAAKHGLSFRDFGSKAAQGTRTPDYDSLNDSLISKLVQLNPLLKGSEAAMANFLNEQALAVYKKWAQPMIDAGVSDPKRYEAIADVLNHAIGHSGSDLAKKLSALNVLFSAEYTLSRFNVLADPFIQMRRGNPEAFNLAAKNLMGLAGGNLALLGTLALAGQRTGGWSVNTDPTSGDFGQLKIGNTRYDTLAGFGPLLKTVARIENTAMTADDWGQAFVEVSDHISKYFENKESPWYRVFTEAAWNGREPDLEEIAKNHVPGIAMGVIEAIAGNSDQPDAVRLANAALAPLLGGVSVGVNTYETPEDKANATAKERFDGRSLDELTTGERLSVLDPEDKSRNGPRAQQRERYEEAQKAAGIKEPEKAVPGETREQKKAREERNDKTSKANTKVYAANPELDLQRWYFGSGDNLNSPEGVNLALEANIPNRDITVPGMARAVNATPESKAAWQEHGSKVFKYVDGTAYAEKYGNQEAQKVYKKNFDQLDEAHQRDIVSRIKTQVAQNDPVLDALLAYFGHGGNSTEKVFILNSDAAVAEYRKLTEKYGKDPAREGWRVVKERK